MYEKNLDALERRLDNLEKLSQHLAGTTGIVDPKQIQTTVAALESRATREKGNFAENSKYEIQIVHEGKNSPFAESLQKVLRKRGYRTSIWTTLSNLEENWGYPPAFLEGRVTLLSPPDKTDQGTDIVEVLTKEVGITNPKIGIDRHSRTGLAFGLIIPPGYSP